MKHFDRARIMVMLLILTGFLGGCAPTTRVFFDNFEKETLGAEPDPSPAGNPAGDAVEYTSDLSQPQHLQIIIRPPFTNNALAIRRTNPSPWASPVYFKSIPVKKDSNHLTITWVGFSEKDADDTGLIFTVFTSHFQEAMSFTLKHGKVYATAWSGNTQVEQTVGDYTKNTAQVVILHIYKKSGTYSLSILQGPTPGNIQLFDRPILEKAFFDDPVIYLGVAHTGTEPLAKGVQDVYVIDEVLMVQSKDP